MSVKAPIKWVGSKAKILKELLPVIRENIDKYDYYIEPFVGGGSVFLNLINESKCIFVLNDKNRYLIEMFLAIRDNVDELIVLLKQAEDEYNSSEDKKTLHYNKRNEFNESKDYSLQTIVLFMTLIKTNWYGLYRVGSTGKYNTPFGFAKHLNFNVANIKKVSELLNKNKDRIIFENKDYQDILDEYKDKSCLIYFDPPYYKTHVSYSKDNFDHEKFAEIVESSTNNIVVSNSKDFLSLLKNKDAFNVIEVNILERFNQGKSTRNEIILVPKN